MPVRFEGLYPLHTSGLKSTRSSLSDSPLSSTSTLALEDDHIRGIFRYEKLSADHESDDIGYCELPPTALANITDILEHVDIYDVKYGRKELNPTALPFTPKGPMQVPSPAATVIPKDRDSFSSISPSSPILHQHPTFQTSTDWRSIFHTAIHHPRPTFPVIVAYAQELVNSNRWDQTEGEMIELTKLICFQAMVNDDSKPEVLAPLAGEIQLCLKETFGEHVSHSFAWHLREGTMGVFKASWCITVCPNAISYHNSPSEEYVYTATAFLRFIGELFSMGVLIKENISMCLSVLVHELVSIEHIEAIRTLLESAQVEFWYSPKEAKPSGEMIRCFIHHFSMKVDNFQGGITPFSVLGRPAGPEERNAKVHDVLSMLSEWWGGDRGF